MGEVRLLLGALGSDLLYEADVGYLDNATPYDFLGTTDRLAPAGIGGECLFYALYITLEHEAAQTVRVTPIVDGVALDVQEFDLLAPASRSIRTLLVMLRIRFPNTVPNYDTRATFAPRGTWIQVKIETANAIEPGYFGIHGVEVEHEVLRSTLVEGINQ